MVRRCRCRCISGSIASGTSEGCALQQNETQTRLFGLVAFVIVVIVRYLHHRSHRPLIPAAGAIARTHPIWLPIAPLRSHRSILYPTAKSERHDRSHVRTVVGPEKTGRHALRTRSRHSRQPNHSARSVDGHKKSRFSILVEKSPI